ncbi:helix-turn-helix domain-containing protein [Acholeplasma hippikon]|uniref:Regulatory protein soxS n=1 Tax=Acholeplasma hippikon TaxID=264636 RepID=A0A449BKE7_9MOLU|nr:helix-turn-helix domain-containing protein [Acholeplasma hippikon]VEU82900.1 Regulatory protein soxS [Acholeplasma hippikon]
MDEKIKAVQRMQDYIKIHIDEEIIIVDLVNISLYSPWYTRKIFIELIGITPADYIRKLKLRNAALSLRDEKTKVIDLAYELGYESVDGFQRAFYREFGCNPKEYANNPVPLKIFNPYRIENKHKKEMGKMTSKNIFITVVERPERKVIIKRGVKATHYFDYCNEVGCDVWGILLSMKSIANEPVCMWLPKKYILPNTSEYVQGVEVALDYDGIIPEGFDVIKLPKSKYIMFQGEPFKEEDYNEAIAEIWEAEKKYDPSVIGYMYDDSNPRIQLEPIGTRGYIKLLPIKESK